MIASESDDKTYRLLKNLCGRATAERAHGMRTGSTNNDVDFSWFGNVSGRRGSRNLNMSQAAVEEIASASEDKETIDSLIQQLREKDALIAEKGKMLAKVTKDSLIAEEKDEIKPIQDKGSGEEDDEFAVGNDLRKTIPSYQPSRKFQSSRNMSQSCRNMGLSSRNLHLSSRNLSTSSRNLGISTSTKNLVTTHEDAAVERTEEEMKVVRTSLLGRRGAHVQWDDINVEFGEEDDDDDHHHGNTAWYLPPVQRQRWCDDQVSSHWLLKEYMLFAVCFYNF